MKKTKRDPQKESCSRSNIVLVNRSNSALSSFLKDPNPVNPGGKNVAQLALM
jgi:hypothetical protein